MSYKVNFTNRTNDPHLIVNDNTINTETSLAFPGRNQKGYAVSIAENFLHLLENFANLTAPSNPIKGQLWYNTTDSELKVYDGTTWKPSGALKKGDAQPINRVLGDLWVDTNNQQLNLYDGSQWVLVGPTFSSGLKTGATPEKIKESSKNQLEYAVLKDYVDDRVVTITSSNEVFTPQSGILGFTSIKPGMNLNSNSTYKYWGTSEKAEALIVGGKTVVADNFFQKTESNTTTGSIQIKNNTGISVGNDSQLQLRIADQASSSKGVLFYSTPSSRMDIRLNVGPVTFSETTLISLVSSSGNVGIGINNINPQESLSVLGTGSFTGAVKITSSQDATDINTAALVITGGLAVKKQLIVNGNTTITGNITSGSILPTINNTSNIGSNTYKYANVYATNFNGNVVGTVTGTVTGNVVGTASGLTSSTPFTMIGDVTSPGFSFNGSSTFITVGSFIVGRDYEISSLGTAPNLTDFTLLGASQNTIGIIFTATGTGAGNGTGVARELKRFNTTIAPTFINNKDSTDHALDDDELILYRQSNIGTNVRGNYKVTKQNLLKNLPLVPIGSIFPYAGKSPPPGYLFCDGSEVTRSEYTDLFNIIGDTYISDFTRLVGSGTFKLPDLRGRFPLGKDDMDNTNTVPDKTVTDMISYIPAGGGVAGRVNAPTARTLGNSAGAEQTNLSVSQLPQHNHNLLDTNNDQFYVTNNSSSASVGGTSTLINGPTVSSTTPNQHLTTTGNVNSNTVGQPVVLMNPYLTINYIIYTGVYI